MSVDPVDQLRRERDYLRGQVRELAGDAGLVGDSPALRRLTKQLRAAADSVEPALLRGEPGVGAEALARCIHDQSARANGPFVAVNCRAVPEGMLASELFGHVRGAFPEALGDRVGQLELADGGTLFLSDLCDLHPALQDKLAQALGDGAVVREGGSRTRRVELRALFGTTREPSVALAAGRLSPALYYAASALTIEIPPLRARVDDLLPLARQRLEHLARRHGLSSPTLTADDEARLLAYSWPGNLRELELVLERALLLGVSGGFALQLTTPTTPADESAARLEPSREEVLGALATSEWVVARAARKLGLSRQAMYRRIERYALRRPPQRSP
ncbi:MAG: sigma-54-dependent Fis family transcriptional regulator [Myxococcales bacterium]|nr:sigma-54-dependent Fis family transcriptional regulator [Myxococcales bacterium]